MVNLKERTTAWGEILKSFWIGSAKEDDNDNEKYKQWEEMNSKYLRDTNKSIQELEEGTSAPTNGRVKKSPKKQIGSTKRKPPTNTIENSRQQDDGEISR